MHMKNILFLCLLFVSSITFAQTEHLTFKGIPIDGNIKNFTAQLKRKGFELLDFGNSNNTAALQGEFAGKDCTVLVLATHKDLTVCKILAFTSKYISWYSVKRSYLDYQELYTKKYGRPLRHFEFFSEPYYEGDGFELQALKKEKCTYSSFWEMDNGFVSVNIDDDASIRFVYEDKTNMNIYSNEKEQNQLNDI